MSAPEIRFELRMQVDGKWATMPLVIREGVDEEGAALVLTTAYRHLLQFVSAGAAA